MIRKQVVIEERHERFLKETAAEAGVSEGELVRRALDLLMSGAGGGTTSAERRRAAHALLDTVDAMAAQATPLSVEGWSRDELYAEREARWTR